MPKHPLFRNRYRIPSTRLKGWNYMKPGAYFITICTNGRYPWFGKIIDQTMCLSPIGLIADQYWRSIGDHFPHVTIDQHVVMPDHIHGIIVIGERGNVERTGESIIVETCESHVSTTTESISTKIKRPSPGSLGSIIGQYKSTCTKHIRQIDGDFGWQPRFHDHIIRNDDEMARIRMYIHNNPLVWKTNAL